MNVQLTGYINIPLGPVLFKTKLFVIVALKMGCDNSFKIGFALD